MLRSRKLTPYDKFLYQRMSFGLANATATFQRLMDIVLAGLEQHMLMMSSSSGSLGSSICKCGWGKEYLNYQRHRFGAGQVAIPSDRTKAIRNYQCFRLYCLGPLSTVGM